MCNLGCDAKPSEYYRPEESIMISLNYPYFNSVSIKATYFPDGLEKRLLYFVETLIYSPVNIYLKRELNRGLFSEEEYHTITRAANPDNKYQKFRKLGLWKGVGVEKSLSGKANRR